MTRAEAFLRQARSDYAVFTLLLQQNTTGIAPCHSLQHLQMATEKLSKCILAIREPDRPLMSHVAFREILPIVQRPITAANLGYGNNPRAYKDLLDRRRGWFLAVEQLSPSVGTDVFGGGQGPNVEYPWQTRDQSGAFVWQAPADYSFQVFRSLQSSDGVRLLQLIERLLERLPAAAV